MNRILIPALCALSLLVSASAAEAHTMSLLRAKNQVRAKAAVTYVEVGATFFRLGSCDRLSAHSFTCSVKFFDSGEVVCKQEINTKYRSKSSYLTTTRIVSSSC